MKRQHRMVKKWIVSEQRWEFYVQQRCRKFFLWGAWLYITTPEANEKAVQELYMLAVANNGLHVVIATEGSTD